MDKNGVCSLMTNSTDDKNVLLLTSALTECTRFRHLMEKATKNALEIEENKIKAKKHGRTKN